MVCPVHPGFSPMFLWWLDLFYVPDFLVYLGGCGVVGCIMLALLVGLLCGLVIGRCWVWVYIFWTCQQASVGVWCGHCWCILGLID
jgi:hypothetical protein